MRLVLYFVLLFFSLIIQSTVFQAPGLQAIAPSLIVIALVLIGVFRGSREGLLFGIVIGLIQDTSFGSFLGQSAFAYALIGYFSGYLSGLLMRVGLFMSLLMVGVSTEIYIWLTYAISRLFGQLDVGVQAAVVVSTHMALSTIAFTLVLYPLYRKVLFPKAKLSYPDETNES